MATPEEKIKFLNWRFVHEVRVMRNANNVRNSLPEISRNLNHDKDKHDLFGIITILTLVVKARALTEFFYGSKYSACAKAKDFISNWEAPVETDNIKELKDRVNPEFMHMDWKGEDITKNWKDLDGLVADINNIVKVFLNDLEKEHSDYFEDNLQKLKNDLK